MDYKTNWIILQNICEAIACKQEDWIDSFFGGDQAGGETKTPLFLKEGVISFGLLVVPFHVSGRAGNKAAP
jgi:hypothetical protein